MSWSILQTTTEPSDLMILPKYYRLTLEFRKTDFRVVEQNCMDKVRLHSVSPFKSSSMTTTKAVGNLRRSAFFRQGRFLLLLSSQGLPFADFAEGSFVSFRVVPVQSRCNIGSKPIQYGFKGDTTYGSIQVQFRVQSRYSMDSKPIP